MSSDGETPGGAGDRGDLPPRLFVYGSLRKGEESAMASFLHGHARYLGRGTIRARLYGISWYAGAVMSDDPADAVLGDVFELEPATAGDVLAALDEYEGADFERLSVEVIMADETRVAADAYLYAASVAGRSWIAHGDWPRQVRQEHESG
ncbi:MAG TPA: gamma-glutamylcyclotransferase family protein [Longimicrobium sp.]